jgi:Tfp pilus assembly protein PilX
MTRNNKGTVQYTLVVILSAATLLVLAGVIYHFVSSQISKRGADKKMTQEIAEEGMQFALRKISEDPAWTEGFQNIKCQSGFYSVKIEKIADSTFKAVAMGFSGSIKTTLICTYKLELNAGALKPKPLSWEYN